MSSQWYGDFAVVRPALEGSVCLFGKIDSSRDVVNKYCSEFIKTKVKYKLRKKKN